MKRRHRARLDSAAETIAHHQVVTLAQFLYKLWYFAEVIAVVSVAHNNESALRCGYSCFQRRAVASFGDTNHSCSMRFSKLDRTVGRAIICHHHFATQPRSPKRRDCFVDAERQRLHLVETRNYHRNIQDADRRLLRRKTCS